MRLTLVEKRRETDDTKSFFFAGDSGLTWKAGQYIHYKLPHADPDARGIERYFSIASAPFEKRVRLTCRFAHRSSSFKKALDALPIGSEIEADPPEGDFCVDDLSKPLVFIAGGIGITPFRAILLDLEHRQQAFQIQLLYANRGEDAVFRGELDSLAKRRPSLRICYYIGDDRLDAKGIQRAAPELDPHRFYVSGPEPMVESFDKILKELGVPEKEIENDFFPGYEWP
jgi:ferredoxin-NADP reductase